MFFKNNEDYIFKPNNMYNKGIIIYPGAKVESKAYAKLAYKLSEKGIYTIVLICHLILLY